MTQTPATPRGTERSVARAEHVGSLLRPAALQEAVQAHVRTVGSLVDAGGLEELRAVTEDHIRAAVAHQESTGIDVVSDGEFRRIIFTDSFYGAVSGFELTEEKLVFRDDEGEELPVPFIPAAAQRLELIANPLADEARFLRSVTDRSFKVTLPAVSTACAPESYRPDLFGDAYRDEDDVADHVVALERELIDAAVAEGATYVQLDLGMYPYLVDPDQQARLAEMGADADTLLDRFLRVDAAVIDGLPDNVETAMHLCRGNLKSKWLWRGSLEPVAERLFHELPYDRFLVEWDDVEREDDFSILQHVPQGENGPVIVLGIVSSKNPELESEDSLLGAIDQASQYLPTEQLAISPQCGFASNVIGNDLTEDDQWRKLELVARVANRLW